MTNLYPLIVNNVTYGYPGHTPILKNVSLRIEKGQKILIQGVSGAGKTTLGQILAGLIQPEHGLITIGGLSMGKIPMSQIGQILHYIPQNNQLFEQSLYFNLTYGLEKVDEDLLNQLIELFGLKHLIEKGEGRILSRDGLSGGERQRIAIIRALLHKPKILILDEALRSIDSAMNKVVLQTVLDQVETPILINHHSTDLGLFDQIFEVKRGSITLIKSTMKKAS